MDNSDGEIEYLDEDEELVQQCIQLIEPDTIIKAQDQNKTTLNLRSRKILPSRSKKRKTPIKTEEHDSDYDPTESLTPVRTPFKPKLAKQSPSQEIQPKKTITLKTKRPLEPNYDFIKEYINKRRKVNINIPDYEDPLCLPVRMVKKGNSDKLRLKKWNDLCLKHLELKNKCFKADDSITVSSTRSVELRNINSKDGKQETVVHGKVTVLGSSGHKRIEEYKGLLPNYREMKLLQFNTKPQWQKVEYEEDEEPKYTSTVILSTIKAKDSDSLVVYKPKDAVSAVFTTVEQKVNNKDQTNAEIKKYLKETAVCRICPSCYHFSARFNCSNNDDGKNNPITCAVCSLNFTSTYNLLSHFKSHSSKDIAKKKEDISKSLAQILSYHYKCSICGEKLSSIKNLRAHLKKHTVSESFHCEVCNKYIIT